MKSLSEYNQAVRRYISRLFTYLQDSIIYEFPWLVPGSLKALEILESRKKHPGGLTSKQIFSELFTFFLISAFFTVLMFLLKYTKDDEEEEEEEEEDEYEDTVQSPAYPMISENAIVESSGSSVYSVALDPGEFSFDYTRRDCGDSPMIPRIDEIPSINAAEHNSFLRFPNFLGINQNQTESVHSLETSSSISSSFESQRRKANRPTRQYQQQQQHQHNQHQQLTTRHIHNHGRADECECLVRRTRSGRIYGRYPS